MKLVHLMIQGKGGVGKSLAASFLAQYLIKQGQTPLCIDVDPTNPTFAGFPRFEAKKIALLEDNDINPRKFDTMMELIAESTGTVVIDSGSSSYNSLSVTCYPFLDHSAGR
jgi:nitrogenase subunit NifH